MLLDTVAGTEFGGTDRSFPWNWARELIVANRDQQFILAGGLNSENVAEAINQARPFGVVVASGVEAAPGRKDIYRVRDLLRCALYPRWFEIGCFRLENNAARLVCFLL